MIKTKWFEVSTQERINVIADALSTHRFRRGASTGVELISVSDRQIEGKFIEELHNTEIYVDPFGDEIRNEVRRFSIFAFVIFRVRKGHYLLRITAGPRNLRSFVQFLSDAIGFGLAVSPIVVDVAAFLKMLKVAKGFQLVRVKKIRAGQIRLAGRSVARVEITSAADAFDDLTQTIELGDAILEKASVDFHLDGLVRNVELTATGSLTTDLSLLPVITPMFIKCFGRDDEL
ncbi:hypothetical protein FVF58_33385 [Paraburkholderia panacisoli]|uniref:Uncharacterized protein n=1 Tax=Paraburkholderia panacisoli TaxID=2603818 RepID=A0A5B0GNL9_9BURK|nr:hypothetical protein [Paraburkholderia panacisoli]KAA1004038.1 hypothetical protein FVF58_33385 [Paraburkholderia panacisoli]